MKKLSLLIFTIWMIGCSDAPKTSDAVDSMSPKDSMKKALKEDLPPPDEIHQFNWFYSAFAESCFRNDDTAFNVCINSELGLWIIDAPGAMPHFTKVKSVNDYLSPSKKKLLPLSQSDMTSEPKEEMLPKADCNKSSGYDKEGCFTTQTNVFKEEHIWTWAGLRKEDEDAVKKSAETITRTVVNTKVGKFYFSLIGGKWFLTFVDVRKPCAA